MDSHGHLFYPMDGVMQEEIVTLDMPEYRAYDQSVQDLLKYRKRGRPKPPAEMVEKMYQAYLTLLAALNSRIDLRRQAKFHRFSAESSN